MRKLIYTLTILSLSISVFSQSNGFEITEKNTMQGTKYGVSKNGEEIIPHKYDVISDYSFGKFAIVNGKKVGVIDTLNQIIIPFEYNFISDFLGDITFLSKEEKLAMANDKGKILTPFIFDNVLAYQNGIATVVINNEVGFFNNQGKELVKPKLIDGFSKGNFLVGYTKSWKSLGYNYVQKDFFGNVLDKGDVGMSGKLPIIFNKDGKIIYKGSFGERVEITPNDKLALVELYVANQVREYSIINENGQILQNINTNGSVSIQDEWFMVRAYNGNEYKTGIIDFETGQWLLPQNFKNISDYEYNNNTLAKVEFSNGDFFYIDKKAKCVEFKEQTCPE